MTDAENREHALFEQVNRSASPSVRQGLPDLKKSLPDSDYWVFELMLRMRHHDVVDWASMYKNQFKESGWAERNGLSRKEYFDTLNNALATILDTVRSEKGLDTTDMREWVVQDVAKMLQAQRIVRGEEAVQNNVVRKTTITNRGTAPEDRLLNAMAALLEDAAGKSPSHQQIMAQAGAEIASAVRGIMEIRQHEGTSKPVEQSMYSDAKEAAKAYYQLMDKLKSDSANRSTGTGRYSPAPRPRLTGRTPD